MRHLAAPHRFFSVSPGAPHISVGTARLVQRPSGQGGGVPLDLADGLGDLVHVLLVAEQQNLRQPDRLPRAPRRVREVALEEGVILPARFWQQALEVVPLEQAQLVQRRIAGLVGDASALSASMNRSVEIPRRRSCRRGRYRRTGRYACSAGPSPGA